MPENLSCLYDTISICSPTEYTTLLMILPSGIRVFVPSEKLFVKVKEQFVVGRNLAILNNSSSRFGVPLDYSGVKHLYFEDNKLAAEYLLSQTKGCLGLKAIELALIQSFLLLNEVKSLHCSACNASLKSIFVESGQVKCNNCGKITEMKTLIEGWPQ
jgi:hypothetical protein